MSIESEIQSEIEALKTRFSETKSLYREACALLFFRYGITPTASKLYQYVRKGSMSAPADALFNFWEELRSKARVQIDHPALPEALKVAAADAVQVLWGQATELARTELASLRVEAQAEAAKAAADLDAERQRTGGLEVTLKAMAHRAEELAAQHHACASLLEDERRCHAATTAKADSLQRQVEELQVLQERIRGDFSSELDKGRAAIEAAHERATGAERRALREIEQERVARADAEKQLEAMRSRLTEVEHQSQSQALEFATKNARLGAELETARSAVAGFTATCDGQAKQLKEVMQQVSQFRTEAETLRSLVEQFKPAAPSKSVRAKRSNG